MGEERSKSLTRTEFEAVMKRATSKEIEIRFEQVDAKSTLIEIRVDPDIRGSYTVGAGVASVVLGGGAGFSAAGLAAAWFLVPAAPALLFGGLAAVAIGPPTAWIIGRYSRRARREVEQELEAVLDRLEQGEDLASPPASWRRWVTDQARRFRVEIAGSKRED